MECFVPFFNNEVQHCSVRLVFYRLYPDYTRLVNDYVVLYTIYLRTRMVFPTYVSNRACALLSLLPFYLRNG